MIYWLLIFVMNPENGQFANKINIPTTNKESCLTMEKNVVVNNEFIKTLCVSNDHYTGVKYDDGVELEVFLGDD